MARDYVKIARDQAAATESQTLLAFIGNLRAVIRDAPLIVAKMQHNFDDSNPAAINWTDLGVLYGIPAGFEQTVFDMLNGTLGAQHGTMENDQAVNLVNRVG